MSERTASEIAAAVAGQLLGDGARKIKGVAPISHAAAGLLSFVDNEKAWKALATTAASAVLVNRDPGDSCPAARIVVGNVRLALAQAMALFHQRAGWGKGTDPSAIVAKSATIGADVAIGPLSVIGEGCKIGARTVIDAGVVLYPQVQIGADCHIQSRCVIREGTVIGDRVILQPSVVIGADGFGYAQDDAHNQIKIHQLGIVVIEDDVEIGAGTCVDRATMGATRVRKGAKIDDLVMIGHNCEVGEHAILCGQVGMAGSSIVEHHAMLAGQVGLAGHLRVGAGAQVGAQSGVHADVQSGAKVIGSPVIAGREFARMVAALPKVPELLRRVRAMEAELAALKAAASKP